MASQPPLTMRGLQIWLGVAVLLWALSCVLAGTWPRVPRLAAVGVAFLLAQGWWMTVNAPAVYDPQTAELVARDALWAAAPGAIEATEARLTMWTLTGILGVLCMVTDLARERRWRARLMGAATVCVATVAVAGVLQKLGAWDLAAWHPDRPPRSPMGPFDNHSNASSFLNLGLPVIAALVVLARSRRWRMPVRGALLLALGATAAAAMMTGSKAGVALTGLTLFGLVGWALFEHQRRWRSPRTMLIATAVVGLTLAPLLLMAWPTLADQARQARESVTGRSILWQITADMARESGALGLGPGSFKMAMPQSEHFDRQLYRHWIVTPHVPGTRVSVWSHAHQDYLQAVVEWGWLGTLAWAALVGGAMLTLVRVLVRRGPPRGSPERTVGFALLLALSIVGLHATGDFPLQNPAIQLYVAVYLGLAWSLGEAAWRVEPPNGGAPTLSP